VVDDSVVRDGRISEEKLQELRLLGGESEALDFKQTADLKNLKSRLAFVKDVVSLANSGGGFLVIGCDNQGGLAINADPVDPRQWEAANLIGIVAKYLSVPVLMNSAIHTLDGRQVVLVAIQASMRNLPIPFSMDGEWYADNEPRPHYEFRRGEIWVRSGPRNAPLEFHDWDRILDRHDQDVRDQTRGEGRELIDRVIEAIRDDRRGDEDDDDGGIPLRPPQGPSPLVPGMSWDALDRGIADAFDSPRDTRLRRYANQLEQDIADPTSARDQRQRAVTELVNLAIEADMLDRSDILELAISALHRAYGAPDGPLKVRDMSGVRDAEITNHWLDIAVRMLDLGAYLVRRERWAGARLVYARSYAPERDLDYTYQSWLRHAQVHGSRAGLLVDAQGRDGGAVYLSFAREAAAEEPRLRPDLGEPTSLEVGSTPDGRDPLLDSIAQFDALCTVMSEAGVTTGNVEHYPSFATLRNERVLPILDRIAGDAALRADAFPGLSDTMVADALVRTIEVARRESRWGAGVWFVPTSGTLGRFINANRSSA
jgi:hypothetical protein